jgi:hypothetical protein
MDFFPSLGLRLPPLTYVGEGTKGHGSVEEPPSTAEDAVLLRHHSQADDNPDCQGDSPMGMELEDAWNNPNSVR